MDTDVDPTRLQAISSMLGQEICRPLDSLEANLGQMLGDPTRPLSATERDHALTMLTLCDDLRRLTHDYLGSGGNISPVPMGKFAR